MDQAQPIKRRSRRICCCAIKSNWSILNQIMISLLSIVSLSLFFISAQVLIGLVLTKDYFLHFSLNAIIEAINQEYTTDAQLIALDVDIQNGFNYNAIPSYSVNTTNEISLAVKYASILIQEGTTSRTAFFFDDSIPNSPFFVACYITEGLNHTNTQLPITLVSIVVPASNAENHTQQIISNTVANFDENFEGSILTMVASFCLLLLLGYLFTLYIVRPLKQLSQYAQHINRNITQLSYGKTVKKHNKIELSKIQADDKIGELVDEFKDLIQGLAGLKKKQNYQNNYQNKPIVEGHTNYHSDQFKILEHYLPYIKSELLVRQ